MLLGYFTEDAYERLLNDVEENKDKYSSEDEWLDNYFGRGVVYYGLSSVEVSKFTPYYSGSKNDDIIRDEDLNNAIRIHEAYKITPLQATNKYMWAYLCHTDKDCRKYIQKRWEGGKPEERFFVPSEGMGLYFFNALSRLWWWAHLTYDPDNTRDHYALTKILFANQMLGKDLLDTLNRTNFVRMKGILLALQEFKEMLGPREGMNQYFRDCKKILNHYAAINMFDFLGYEDIKAITLETLINVRNENSKNKT